MIQDREHRILCDFDEFTELTRDWDIDFKQLESGLFNGEILQYIHGSTQFLYARLNRRIEQLGSPPRGFRTFAIPAVSRIHLRWCGMSVPEDSVLVFQPHRGLDCVSWDDFKMNAFSISESRLYQLCDDLGFSSLPEKIDRSDIIQCQADSLAKLRQVFAMVNNTLARATGEETMKWIHKILEGIIPKMLLQALVSADEPIQIHLNRKQDSVIGQLKEYLEVSPNPSPKIYDLCELFDVSKRTLELAFQEYAAVTPKEYLNRHRLNQVRKLLRKKSRKEMAISNIANRFGFWHMGQFAADYRKLFGELPSETFMQHS